VGVGLVVAAAQTGVVERRHKGIVVRVWGGKRRTVSFQAWTRVARNEGIARYLEDRGVVRTIYQMQGRVHLVHRRRLEGEDGKAQNKMKMVHQVFLVPRRDKDCPIVLLNGGLAEVEIPRAEMVERTDFPRDFVGVGVGLGLPMV